MAVPYEYSELKYLRVKNRAINTGVSANRVTSPQVEVRAKLIHSLDQQRVFGIRDDLTHNNRNTFEAYINARGFWAYTDFAGGQVWTSTGDYADNEYHKFFMGVENTNGQVHGFYSRDDDDQTERTWDYSTVDNDQGYYIYLLGTAYYTTDAYNASKVDSYLEGEFYGAKLWSNGNLVRDYVPVMRKSDGVIGVYDLVNDTFDAGTGPGYWAGGPAVDSNAPDPRELGLPQYELEIWDWRTNTYIADITNIVRGGINMSWVLDDVESLDFEIDLVQFENRCREMGVNPYEVLTPYVHDIRVRRNTEYILGCQVVEANINISNNDNDTIEVRCTGFLNLFKDRYISEPLAGYTYGNMAQVLVERGQQGTPIIKNPTGDIDTSYWLAANGYIHQLTSGARIHSGAGAIAGNKSGSGWITFGTQMTVNAGTPVHVSAWVAGEANTAVHVREREYMTVSTGQKSLYSFTPSVTDRSYHIEFDFVPTWTNGYIVFEMNRASNNVELVVDDCFVIRQDDDDILMDFNVRVGVNNTGAQQSKKRAMNYELQNIKDALIGLTQMEEDNFDFSFEPDRTFNIQSKKGWFKNQLELRYPGNIDGMSISRTASDLANKITNIGSGIGDERLEVIASSTASRARYGTRESVITNNNVSRIDTLSAQADGLLVESKFPTNLPSVTISDGSINPSIIETGDTLPLIIGNGDEYLSSIAGFYRVMEMNVSVDEEHTEQVRLTLKPLGSPESGAKKIRYIKDYIHHNTTDSAGYKQWVQIEAIQLNGTSEVNVARGAMVIGCDSDNRTYVYPEKATNGNTDSGDFCYCDDVGGGALLVDLGAEYEVDYIRVWHIYSDGRKYYGNTLSVGNTYDDSLDPLETILWQNSDNTQCWTETSEGHKSDLIYFR